MPPVLKWRKWPYRVDYSIHIDTREAALELITHMPFNGNIIDTKEVADYAGLAIGLAINQVTLVGTPLLDFDLAKFYDLKLPGSYRITFKKLAGLESAGKILPNYFDLTK